MEDALETCSRRIVLEHSLGQSCTIQMTLGVQDPFTERGDDFRQSGSTGHHHLAGNLVGIEYRNSQILQVSRGLGFTGTDATSDSQGDHSKQERWRTEVLQRFKTNPTCRIPFGVAPHRML